MHVTITHQIVRIAVLGVAVFGIGVAQGTLPSSAQELRSTATKNPFIVFDGTAYRSKPNLSAYGIRPLNIIYVSWFGEKWYKGPAKMELPDEQTARRLAREAFAKDTIVAIDIEHWPLDGDDAVVGESLRKYSRVAEWFHDEAPGLRLGYFGIVPKAAYGWSLGGPSSLHYKEWQAQNNQLRPLAREMDVIFPHTYTYYPDQKAWVTFAIENIKEARRYGKPVYVFLWPKYTENAKGHENQYLPADYWKLQLETVRQYADGLVIWGGYNEEWNEHAGWWEKTKEFMEAQGGPGYSHLRAPTSSTVR